VPVVAPPRTNADGDKHAADAVSLSAQLVNMTPAERARLDKSKKKRAKKVRARCVLARMPS
jgi:hypothetical protein